ncbi:hypothetical protein BJV78DRAFT_1228679 [Lactifluus subvellereus]|nr:hypothetical protein BJV78DRAFT_1228679 [Lactifluus subvellereus]
MFIFCAPGLLCLSRWYQNGYPRRIQSHGSRVPPVEEMDLVYRSSCLRTKRYA